MCLLSIGSDSRWNRAGSLESGALLWVSLKHKALEVAQCSAYPNVTSDIRRSPPMVRRFFRNLPKPSLQGPVLHSY